MNRATTIRPGRAEGGAWLAIRSDVGLVGSGPTAARAAANYCERVAERGGSPGT